MMSFFVGFAFFELGVFCGFFAASLMQAARTGEIMITVKEDTDGTGKEYPFGAANCAGQHPKPIEIDDDLKALQQAVGGSIGASYPFEDPVAIVYNDDGKLMGLPLNRALRDESGEAYDVVAGTFLVVGLGEEDFASLSPELTQKYEELFHQPETFMRLGRQMLVLPVPDENVRTETAKAKPPAAHER